MSAPRRGQQEPLSARSRAARAGGRLGGRRSPEISAREQPGKRQRNWVRSAAARPCTSCGSGSSEGGDAAPPPAVLGTTKVSWQWGPAARDGGDESSRPSPDSEAPRSSKAPSARAPPERGRDASTSSWPAESPEGAHCQLRSHPATPSPVRRRGSARLFLCVTGTHDVPATLQGQWQGSSLPDPRAPRSPETVGKGSGFLPRPVSRGQLVAPCGFSVGSPELISEDRGGPSSSSPFENPPSRGGGLLPREVQRSGESKDLPPGPWAGKAAGGRAGVGAPWGARPRRLRGKFSPTLEVWRPGREQPRYCWVGPGVGQNLWSKARAQPPARGRPFWAGSRLGAEGGAEVV